MFKKKLGSIVVVASLILFTHSISTISEGASTGRMRIIPGENDDFYYEDGTKVPDDIAGQIRESIQKGSPRRTKKPKRAIRRDESVEITKDEIFSKKHYSLSDYYQLGVLSFYDEAKSRGDAFMDLIKKMRDSTARFRRAGSKIKVGASRSSVGSATAVFLPNGYVLTAGHCVREMEEGELTNIQVATVGGSKFKAEIVDSSFAGSIRADWAVLKLLESYKGSTASIGTYKKDDEVIIMGYPARFSHDENYRVFQPNPMFFYSDGGKAYAIPFIGRIIGEGKISLTVGSDMIGGCSGGPVFNLKGEVIGIVSGGRRTAASDTEVRFYPAEKVLKKHPELAEPDQPYVSHNKNLIITHISSSPKKKVEKIGDRSAPNDLEIITYTAHLWNIGRSKIDSFSYKWLIDGKEVYQGKHMTIQPNKKAEINFRWQAKKGSHSICCFIPTSNESLTIHSDALTVKIAMEESWYDKERKKIGCVEKRVQQSFNQLHKTYKATVYPDFAPEGIEERFRIDDFEIYKRTKKRSVPQEFWNHPEYDLYIAYDEGGPTGCYYSRSYSIGHNYPGNPGHAGLFSDWGEACLFHEIGHFRGVEDLYVFNVGDEAIQLLGVEGKPIHKGYQLPAYLSSCAMNNPYKPVEWCKYTAYIINSKLGVSRVGECEELDNPYGHMWNDIPKENKILVKNTKGEPCPNVKVSVYRSERVKINERELKGLPKNAKPFKEGKTDAQGIFSFGSDPLNKTVPREKRSLWVFAILSKDGKAEYYYITLLDFNLAFWESHKEPAIFTLQF